MSRLRRRSASRPSGISEVLEIALVSERDAFWLPQDFEVQCSHGYSVREHLHWAESACPMFAFNVEMLLETCN